MEILVLAYQGQSVFAGVTPDREIGCAAEADIADVARIRIDIGQSDGKAGRQILVEQ